MEPETGAAAKGKDSDDDQNAPDSSSLTGKKADQDQQIFMDTRDTNWYKSTQALKYLQPVFVPIVKDKMKSLQLKSMTDFGRQLCAEATSDDIIQANDNMAEFKHLCPATVDACQKLLNIIKGHTTDSVNFYQMLKGTDPQQWLKSPFEFVRLFLESWMRRDIHDFQECDITALCTIIKRCKPLMQIFDKGKLDSLRKVRNRTMHPATMSISQQEMENNIDVILDFLEHIKSLKSSDDVTDAIESIKQLRTGDVRLLHSMVVRLIQEWLPDARIAYEYTSEQAKNQLQDIKYMETVLASLSSGQEITSIKQSAEHEFSTKKEEKRELEKQNEQLSKPLQIQQEENRELEEQNKKLKERLEHLQEPLKRTTSGGQRFPMQAFSASTGPGDEHETVKEDCSKPEPPYYSQTLSELERLDPGRSPATGCTDVSTITVESDTDKWPCYITGMVAISGTQLMLADKNNKCIKLLDLERGTVVGVKELPSAPHDVTCVPGSKVAVTIPAFHEIHVFTADQNLKQCGIMSIGGICLGIHCSGDRFFVSCKHPPLVQILNMDGGIIKTIEHASVKYPMYLTCSPDNNFMYVSDLYNATVTCMDMAGSLRWVYPYRDTWSLSRSAGLKLRQGVLTGDKCIYICSSDEIHVVSPKGEKLAGIPFRLTGAKNAAVCYSSQEKTLYVSRYPFAGENGCISRIRMH